MTRDYLTLAPVLAEVWSDLTDALAGEPIHGEVAGVAQTLGLFAPAVHHAAGELIAGQKLARVSLIRWGD